MREVYEKLSLHPSFRGFEERRHCSPYWRPWTITITAKTMDTGQTRTRRRLENCLPSFFGIPWVEFADKDGVYQAGIWGMGRERLQIILLDTLYSRSPFNRTYLMGEPFTPVLGTFQVPLDERGKADAAAREYAWQMLSEKQWQ
jgi:hypothetical protein